MYGLFKLFLVRDAEIKGHFYGLQIEYVKIQLLYKPHIHNMLKIALIGSVSSIGDSSRAYHLSRSIFNVVTISKTNFFPHSYAHVSDTSVLP